MVNQHYIEVKKTASYYMLGNIKTAKKIWFVLHGYGYAAKYFIKKFEALVDDETAIIAPEGLSKFYLKGVDGKIGASWMTKEDRENEINDYVNYLNQLYFEIIESSNNVQINILGFSQGGATACRWVSNKKVKVNNFILWASVFPDDMDFETVSNVNTFFIYGNKDKYVTEERVKKQKNLIPDSVKVFVFDGKHDIPSDNLVKLTQQNNW